MPEFGSASRAALATAHPDLQRLFQEVIKYVDCTVLEGHRGKEAQDRAVAAGNSKTPWPHSKHNKVPAEAVDVVPYPVDWSNELRMIHFAGIVKGIAYRLGIRIRWGGDWNGDDDPQDDRHKKLLQDYPHFELVRP